MNNIYLPHNLTVRRTFFGGGGPIFCGMSRADEWRQLIGQFAKTSSDLCHLLIIIAAFKRMPPTYYLDILELFNIVKKKYMLVFITL